jgi:hypothetical protein
MKGTFFVFTFFSSFSLFPFCRTVLNFNHLTLLFFTPLTPSLLTPYLLLIPLHSLRQRSPWHLSSPLKPINSAFWRVKSNS